MIRLSPSPAVFGIVAGAITVCSCVSEPGGDSDPRQIDVLSSALAEKSPAMRLIAQHRDFIEAMTGGDPTPFMSTRFEFVDWADPATQPSEGLGGRVASGHDYLPTLSERIPHELSHLAAVEAHLTRPDQAVVISKHLSGAHSITHWNRTASDWKAFILILNVPDTIVSRARRQYVSRP